MVSNAKQSVLIIENDNTVIENLSKRFKKRGMLVITARDGYEGYTRACQEIPDFIIAETLLSNMDGFRISRLLKYDERYKNIMIVLITSNDLDMINDMYQASGADNVLRKPFKFLDLIESLKVTEAV